VADAPDDAVDRLYGVALDEFVPARDALARELRDEGRRGEAAAVKALAKPSVAAWAVNQAVRTQRGAARELWRAGDDLAAAQAAVLEGRGSGADLRARRRARAGGPRARAQAGRRARREGRARPRRRRGAHGAGRRAPRRGPRSRARRDAGAGRRARRAARARALTGACRWLHSG
jgi:hypothetical protein